MVYHYLFGVFVSYFQVSFHLKAILYVAKITQNTDGDSAPLISHNRLLKFINSQSVILTTKAWFRDREPNFITEIFFHQLAMNLGHFESAQTREARFVFF